uniref:Uncharacterized protein n=1 Tax=Sphaerodactylus townsendi TaxID=933632 RepID=A0ACB8EDI4_9SAUR
MWATVPSVSAMLVYDERHRIYNVGILVLFSFQVVLALENISGGNRCQYKKKNRSQYSFQKRLQEKAQPEREFGFTFISLGVQTLRLIVKEKKMKALGSGTSTPNAFIGFPTKLIPNGNIRNQRANHLGQRLECKCMSNSSASFGIFPPNAFNWCLSLSFSLSLSHSLLLSPDNPLKCEQGFYFCTFYFLSLLWQHLGTFVNQKKKRIFFKKKE